MSGDLVELTRGGRLACVLCRLARSGFTGLVYAERDDGSLAISIRDGRPVFVEDLGEHQSIPDALLEQGLISKEQYAAIATRVLDSLVDNEDVAFCQVAVETGALTRAQVDGEIERRTRGHLIRAIEWERCRIEVDDDPDSVTSELEYPQDVGALIYMGVRTFFDEERVRALIGSEPQQYARLLRPIAEVLDFFQLDPEEAALLAHVQPDVELGSTIEDKSVDALEGWQLVCMLLLAEMIELQSSPFAPTAERSGVRSARGLDAAAQPHAPVTRPAPAGSQLRMPAVREEQIGRASQARMPTVREEQGGRASQARMPAVREQQVGRTSQARMPAVPREDEAAGGGPARGPLREQVVRAPSRPRVAVPREEPEPAGSSGARPASREEYIGAGARPRTPSPHQGAAPGSRPRMPIAREDAPDGASQPRRPASREQPPSASFAARSGDDGMVSGAPAARRTASIVGQPAVAAQPEAARTHAAAPQASGPAPASAEASIAARARQRPVRKLSTALQRLDRELKQVRGRPATPQPGQAAAAPAAASEGGHGRAHLEQLLRMRASAMAQKQAPGQTELTAADDFRYGQEALRDQQFGRAHEHLRKACDSEPNNEVYAMFSMWAAFRANLMQGDDVNKLRTALRARVSDDEHKAFAYYALGHLSLADKRDDLAEKFFRKAIELNRQNKDAERHLRIIELRRKTAASEQRAGKIFGIEIGIKKS